MRGTNKFVVGIGASAGGLKALEQFFSAVQIDSGCSYVVVQHLSPDFKSILEELLARKTKLPILRITHGMPVVPNTIFLIPPKKLLTIDDGLLQLSERDIATVAELPINTFFESLAAHSGQQAVGVILSGGGSDGALGLKAIGDAGGLTFAQRPDTAEFESMPRNAMAATFVDHTLAPEEMARIISAHVQDPGSQKRKQPFPRPEADSPLQGEPIEQIMEMLRRASGIDFGKYKIGTVERRIQRRAELQKLPDLADYSRLLAASPQELNALYGDMLIGVTEFFRDAEIFEALRERVLPSLMASDRQNEIRVWVAACATGEEAYSIAILLDEVANAKGFGGNFSIFVTDVHKPSLDFASAGLYELERLKNVSAARLARYFREEQPGLYRVIPAIRRRLTFAHHNLITDPPFTKLDLITCRNLLIYLEADQQDRMLRLFHFSLREGGCLFLGPSEGVGRVEGGKFEVVDAKRKFYRRANGSHLAPPKLHQNGLRPVAQPTSVLVQNGTNGKIDRDLITAYDHILGKHAPDSLLINDAFEILHYFGAAARYLRPLEGRVGNALLDRVDGDLRLCLATLLPKVLKSNSRGASSGVRVSRSGVEEKIDVVADPIPGAQPNSAATMVHVAFLNSRPGPKPMSASPEENSVFAPGDEVLHRIRDLETELQSARESLQTAVEELQASNEELQASNEELTASNEELQSTNEELHAVNEELYTVNTEFERKNVELQLLNDDLNNLSNSTDTGTVFVDRGLRIRKFNPAIQRIFRLLPQDIGRPIDHIAYHLDGRDEMLHDVATVLETGEPKMAEARTQDGRWLLKRVMPFLTAKGAIEGVVLTFTDIDQTKVLQDRLNLAMDSSKLVWWELELLTGRLTVHCGQSCYLGYTASTLPQTAAEWEAATHPDDIEAVRKALGACVDGTTQRWTCEHRFRTADGSWRWVQNGGKVSERDPVKGAVRMLGTTQDISERRTAEEVIQRDAWLLASIEEAIICLNLEGKIIFWNRGAFKLFGWTATEMVGESFLKLYPEGEAREQARDRLEIALSRGELTREREDWRKDRTRIWTEARAVRVNDKRAGFSGLIVLYHDITARKQAEKERKLLEQQLLQAQKMDTMGTLAGGIAHDFNNILAAILGYTELAMAQQPKDERAMRMHEGVLKAAHRARDLVKRILAFSRFQEPERQRVHIHEVVSEVVKFVRAGLPSTIELTVEVPESIPPTLADANQLHQVLMNLATNASHAMRERGGKLTIRNRNEQLDAPKVTVLGTLPAGAYIAIEVSDTGHGITPEVMQKMFDPFFTTKPVGEGTGLGLSIVHGILKSHGGGVDVVSKVGVGTTFTLYIPIVSAAEDPDPAAGSAPPAVFRGQGQRIAVIDDEEDVAKVTQATLQSLGYDVSRFRSAQEFFDEFTSMLLRFELIVTDQTMPHMTGLELSQRLRSEGHFLPIILASGYSKELKEDVLGTIGRVDVIRKPFDRGELAAVVHRMLDPNAIGSHHPFKPQS